jgi:hypothetical protein
MLQTYSFIDEPALMLAKHLRQAYPGLLSVISLYYCSETETVNWFVSEKGKKNEIFEAQTELKELRLPTKSTYNWLDKDSIPLNAKEKQKAELNIFNEMDKLVLSMRFNNRYDAMEDIVYAEFKHDIGILGLQKSGKSISTDQKTLIAELIYSNLQAIHKRKENDYQLWERLSKHIMQIQQSSIHFQKSFEKEQEAYRQSVERLVKEYIISFSKQYNRKIILTKEALVALRKFNGDLFLLKDIIGDALVFAQNVQQSSNEWIINETYFNLNNTAKPIADNKETLTGKRTINEQSPDRETRATQYLYRLSKAIEQLLSSNQKITGVNVGNACNPPVSAPAISEFVGKYRKTIQHIISRDPNKWKLLVDNFRPINNIIKNPIHKKAQSA